MSGLARAAFYSSIGTAANVDVTDHAPAELGFFYDTEGPTTVSNVYDGGLESCRLPGSIGGAQNTAPEASPVGSDGSRAGGYLAVDGAGNLCWALPADPAWNSYMSQWLLPVVRELGATSTLTCLATSTVPAPVDADTWAAGCPPFPDPTHTVPLTLVAD